MAEFTCTCRMILIAILSFSGSKCSGSLNDRMWRDFGNVWMIFDVQLSDNHVSTEVFPLRCGILTVMTQMYFMYAKSEKGWQVNHPACGRK